MSIEEKIDLELSRFRDRFHELNRQIRHHPYKPAWFSESKVILSHDPIRVRRFIGTTPSSIPTLIIYSQINSPHIIDIEKQHSAVQRLMEQGNDVFILEWGEVTDDHKNNGLEVYIRNHIDLAVNFVLEQTKSEKLNLLGICQGGTFSLCYASLAPEKIRKLVTMVTPVDFHAGNSALASLSKFIDFSILEKYPRNVPGEIITAVFQSIRPFHDLQRQVALIDLNVAERRIELSTLMDQWVHHCPPQPGKAFAQFVQQFFQQNMLVSGELMIAGFSIDLANITAPVLNVYATEDHLVPIQSAQALKKHIRKKHYLEQQFEGGHIGPLVSKKAQKSLLPEVAQWLAGPV